MKQKTVAICGKNTRDIVLLEEYVYSAFPDAVIVKYTKGELLVNYIRKNKDNLDVIFLDIGKNEKGEIETAREIRRYDKKVPIVFIADNDQYYRKAFDLFVMQYLLKPVSEKKIQEIFQVLDDSEETAGEKIIYFRYRSCIYTLKHSEVLYISSSLHSVNFHLENGENIHCRGKLSDFEDQLKGSAFFRCC